MKKKLCLLAVLPLTVLSSCGGAKQIVDLTQIHLAIRNIAGNAPTIKNFELAIEAEETYFDGVEQKNVTVKSKSTFEQNEEKGASRYHFVGDRDGEKFEVDSLTFRGTSESPLYGTSHYSRIVKPEGELSEAKSTEIYGDASSPCIVAEELAWQCRNIEDFVSNIAEHSEHVNYFSEGEGNLTIKADRIVWYNPSNSEENDIARYTVHYDENTFKWVYLEEISHTNTKSTYNIRMNPKDEITIELPSDWKSLGYERTEVN